MTLKTSIERLKVLIDPALSDKEALEQAAEIKEDKEQELLAEGKQALKDNAKFDDDEQFSDNPNPAPGSPDDDSFLMDK